MAFEDAKWGSDRVIKKIEEAGYPPKAMRFYRAQAYTGGVVRLYFSPPSNTYFDAFEDLPFVTVGSVTVVKKAGSPITSIDDGEILHVFSGSEMYNYQTEPFIDDDVEIGTTYYYRWFSRSTVGVYNIQADDQDHCTVSAEGEGLIFGFDQVFTDTDPSTTIRYPNDVENYGYEPMWTNEGTGTPTAGSWLFFLQNVLKNFPYMVDTTGRAVYGLDPNDYTKKLDGTPSDYNNTSFSGGAFAWISKLYMKEWYESDGNSRHVRFSDSIPPGEENDWYAVGFHDPDDNELEGLWIPMGYTDANGKVLVAGTTPCASKTYDQEKVIIETMNPDRAKFLGGPIMNVLRDLEYMIYRHTDIQKAGGHGRCNAGSNRVIANAVVPNGIVPGFYGTSTKTTMNKAFHSQVLFSYQQWLRDPYTRYMGYSTTYPSLKMNTNSKYQTFNGGSTYAEGTNYVQSGSFGTYYNPSITGAWQYPNAMQLESKEFGSMGREGNSGSTSTGLCDGLYLPGQSNGKMYVAVRLGYCSSDLDDGPAALSLTAEASRAAWDFGIGTLLLPSVGYEPAIAG